MGLRLENMGPEPVDFPRFFRSVLGGVIRLYLFARFGTLIVNICMVDHSGYNKGSGLVVMISPLPFSIRSGGAP